MTTPEEQARKNIDAMLKAAGWDVHDAKAANVHSSRGVAIREFPLKKGYGFADYLLYVDGKAVGVIEAKPEGTTLTGVEIQAESYSEGFPDEYPAHLKPLPFIYQSTGVVTRFTNHLDPYPKSRRVFHFHKPETFARLLKADPLVGSDKPSSLHGRVLKTMPPIDPTGFWPVQEKAVTNLEVSLRENRPRALIQMATGSGKTFTSISAVYRLIKFARAERVLFLVDRNNLGKQAHKEFQGYDTPDDGRKFTELYNVQRLTSASVDSVSKVVISTIQRIYSMLRGEELESDLEEGSLFDTGAGLVREPVEVAYNPAIPIEYFDFIVIDECHRSIYSIWRQVLDYFDAYLIGLTATPSKQTFGFFNQNLVMEYGHEEAVADGINVDFDVYSIRTRITESGSTIETEDCEYIRKRDRQTREERWEHLDEDFEYDPSELDKKVVAKDQIRTIIRTFKEKLPTEIFPGRTDVPKTLIFAKDDSHADDIVQIVREEFGRGNEFAWKLTYRTTGKKPELFRADERARC